MKFVDQTQIEVIGGKGGDGIATFMTAKGRPKLGPDGGDGGNGGTVFLRGNKQLNTLSSIRYKQLFKADDGVRGGAQRKTGACGKPVYIDVPLGTIAVDVETQEPLGEIMADNETIEVATGGKRGLGNVHFVRSTRQAPRQFTEGKHGQHRNVSLELKLLADIGLAGFPNAGKSTFLSRVSAAKPKIADYPFTTLAPQLGVVDRPGSFGADSIVIADIPGLIEGASEGKGLGFQFLRHLERTAAIVYMIDLCDFERSPLEAYQKLSVELKTFSAELAEKPAFIVLNKSDSADEEAIASTLKSFADINLPVFTASCVTGFGINNVLNELFATADHEREETLRIQDAADHLPAFSGLDLIDNHDA